MPGQLFSSLVENDCGATAIEYGFIGGLLSIAAAAVWNALGTQLVILSATIIAHLGFSGVLTAG
jgi:Flp pilus assembly pilin Flp